MQPAASTLNRDSTIASDSGGHGCDPKWNHSGSSVGPSANGQRRDGRIKPRPKRTLAADPINGQLDANEIRLILDELELPQLPVSVSKWLVRTGIDSADEPAVWVWAVVPDDKIDVDTDIAIQDAVFEFVRSRIDIPAWVYVSFKTTDKLDNLN